jgi:hypothetical protein
MKIQLELNMPDTRIFLNFWDSNRGNDAVCELRGEKLFLLEYDENGDELPEKEITISDFIHLVKQRSK